MLNPDGYHTSQHMLTQLSGGQNCHYSLICLKNVRDLEKKSFCKLKKIYEKEKRISASFNASIHFW